MLKQRLNIKNLFESRPNEWIPLYEITPLAAQYNARIKELRPEYDKRGALIRPGMDIVNMTKRVDGVRHSWYRYTPKVVIISKQQEFPLLKEVCNGTRSNVA
jgi:hypothetical protein